jgi:hypothetical protein
MGAGSTSCQTSPESQAEPLEFYFDLYGSTAQCSGNFVLEWNDIVGVSQWFATIVPLDGSYQPQDIVLPSRSGSFSLTLDYAVGTKFTILFRWVQSSEPTVSVSVSYFSIGISVLFPVRGRLGTKVFLVRCSAFSVQCSAFSVQCSAFSVQCPVFSVQCSVFSVQCSDRPTTARTGCR